MSIEVRRDTHPIQIITRLAPKMDRLSAHGIGLLESHIREASLVSASLSLTLCTSS
jgi:hypothetical protein